jgi:hypothetical protein
MKRLVLFSLLLLNACLVLNACVVQRNVVRQPELSLHITDGTSPLTAKVYLYWMSNPYSRLEQAQTLSTDAQGNLQLEQVLQNDTAYPLLLHGVSEYQHRLCLEAQGYRSLLVTLVALPGDAIRLDVPLSAGESLGACSSYDTLNNHPGLPRPDITAQHESIQGAYDITGE